MLEINDIVLNSNNRYYGDLKHYFKCVCEAPNFHMPYHNFRHMTHVLWEAYDGGVQMGLDELELRILLIGALMHDYNHTGKKGDDKVNIERALTALDNIILEKDRKFIDEIRKMIRVTQYPYTTEQFSENELILRDADQSQTFSLVWMQSLSGLALELGMSFKDMLKLQHPFMKNLKFHTLWGQTKFNPMIPIHLNRVDQMLKLLD